LNASQIVITALGCINPLKSRKIGGKFFPPVLLDFRNSFAFGRVLWLRPFSQEQHLHEDEYGALVLRYGQEKTEEL